MVLRPLAQRVLLSHARPESFIDRTIAILGRLGYRILPVDDWPRHSAGNRRPELMIVDESRLADLDGGGVPAEFADLPRVVLSGRRGVGTGDPRIVGAISRPAGLHDLYRVIQQVCEDTPRTTPRVDTELAVRCDRNGENFVGALVSISENGGLLRCDRNLPLGASFEMRVDLPQIGELALRAEAAYQLLPHLGVVFSGLASRDRSAIGAYVSEVLLA
jgi:hypothetical protein